MIAIVMDAASQHRTKAFKEFVKDNSHRLRIIYLPTGCPEFSAIEECWHQLKIQPFMYDYYEHISGRTRDAMKYLRATAFSQNIEQYLFRKLLQRLFDVTLVSQGCRGSIPLPGASIMLRFNGTKPS